MLRFVLLVFTGVFGTIAQAGDLEVSAAWIRLLPAGVPAGGYFELRNATAESVRLVGASSPAFAVVMLHKSAEDKGRATMMHVDEIQVPPGGKIAFRPGSYHLMLMKPARTLKVGESVPVTLEFAGGNTIAVTFQLRGPAGN